MSDKKAPLTPQEEIEQSPEFNIKVHHRDKKGMLIDVTPYNLYVKGGIQYFERPIGSGNLFFENKEPAGRVERVTDEKGHIHPKFDFEAKHQAYVAPRDEQAQMAHDLESEKLANEALRKELALIKAEAAKKAEAQVVKTEPQPESSEVIKKEEEKPAAKAIPQLKKD